MIANITVFQNVTLLDLALFLNALWFKNEVCRFCGNSTSRLGWLSFSLLMLGIPLPFVLLNHFGQYKTIEALILAGMRIFLVSGLLIGTDWIFQKSSDAKQKSKAIK